MVSPALPTLQIVIPIHNEEELLEELLRRIQAQMEGLKGRVASEVLLVDDGSRDASADIIQRWAGTDSRIRLVQLSRNFGHQPAIAAGLSMCRADAVVVMDGDLQDPPELIPQLVDAWQGGAEVVRAERLSRRETRARRAAFGLFHRFFNSLSDFPIPSNSGVFCLLVRDAYEAIQGLSEQHRFFPGLAAWVGFKQAVVRYHRENRFAGEPKQTWRRLVRYGMDALFSFSYVPLRLMAYCGLGISGLGFAAGLFFALRRLLGQEIAFTGFTTLVILVTFMSGIQLIALGVMGEYLARIYDECKNRPYFILRRQPKPPPAPEA